MRQDKKKTFFASHVFRQMLFGGGTAILIGMKGEGTINWPWWMVLSPLGAFLSIEIFIAFFEDKANDRKSGTKAPSAQGRH